MQHPILGAVKRIEFPVERQEHGNPGIGLQPAGDGGLKIERRDAVEIIEHARSMISERG